MPLYNYHCPQCNKEFEVIHSLKNYKKGTFCPQCGILAKKILFPTNIVMDYEGYQCPITGNWVEGRTAHRANLHKHNCRVLEKGERKDMQRRREEADRKLETKLEETTSRLICQLPPRKREALIKEMKSNLKVEVVRQ